MTQAEWVKFFKTDTTVRKAMIDYTTTVIEATIEMVDEKLPIITKRAITELVLRKMGAR